MPPKNSNPAASLSERLAISVTKATGSTLEENIVDELKEKARS